MTDAPTPPTGPRPGRRFRPVVVTEVRRLTSRLVSTKMTGDFTGFEIAAPTQHIKIVVPGPGEHGVVVADMASRGSRRDEGQSRPLMRTYTPRHFDPATATLEVQFVIHGEGPASSWAERAAPGDALAVAGPGGRMPLPLVAGPWLVAGDESAIPAIGTLLDALPPDAVVDLFIETEADLGGVGPGGVSRLRVTQLHPGPADEPGSQLHDALMTAEVPPGANIWVACEAAAARRIRRTLLDDRHVDAASLVTRGYWRAGQSDHPDHDYADDGDRPAG